MTGSGKWRWVRSVDEVFIKLFAEHQRAIYALIRAFCRRPHDADDVFQETFVVVWRKREEFQMGSNFFAWVASIARYEALAYAKRQGRGELLFDEDLLAQLAEQAVVRAEGASDRLDALRHCLESLSSRHRELIEQRYAAGGSVKALAEHAGRSVNSVSVMLHSLRQRLLECIEHRLAGEGV